MEVAVNHGNLRNIMSCGLLNHKMLMYPSSPFTFWNIPSVARRKLLQRTLQMFRIIDHPLKINHNSRVVTHGPRVMS